MHELRSRLTQRTLAQGKREIRGAVGEVTRLVHQFVTRARTTVGEETISEARRIVGIPAPGDEVELGSEAFTTPSPRVDIPIAYRRLFSDQALDAGDMLTGRVHQVTRVRRILMGEMPGANRAVSVISNDGGDKSAVVQALLRGIGPQCQIIRVAFSEEEAGLQSVQQKMAEAVTRVHKHPKPIIVVEGFQWLFGIRPEGFTALRQFVSTVIQTSDHVGWLVSAELPVWTYADRVVPLHDAFPEQVVLHPLNPEELQSAILGRHTMSGYGLVFKTPASSIKNTIIALFSSKMRRSRFHETAYFTNLHQDSGGLLGDAMRLWMASIDTFDTSANNVLIGTTPHPPIRAIRQLPDDTLITLRQVARQGRITVQDHAEQFRLEEQVSHAYLSRLVHWGLLCRAGKQVFQFHPELAGSLMRILDERGVVG